MEHSQLGQVIILQSEYTLCGAMLLNSILGGWRHITPCLNEQSEAELSEFINTVWGAHLLQSGCIWHCRNPLQYQVNLSRFHVLQSVPLQESQRLLEKHDKLFVRGKQATLS